MTKLWHPKWPCSVILDTGETLVVPDNPAGVEVPLRFIERAIRLYGCLLVGTTFEHSKTMSFDRGTMLLHALRGARTSSEVPDAPAVHSSPPRAAALDPGPPVEPENVDAKSAGQPVSIALDDPLVRRLAAALQ